MHDPDLNQFIRLKCVASPNTVFLYLVDRFEDIPETPLILAHRGIASRTRSSRIPCRSPRSVTTSTRQSGSDSSTIWSAARFRSVHSRSNSTSRSRSRSLSGPAAPRATDPNTHTFNAPCLRAMASISLRRSRTIRPRVSDIMHIARTHVGKRIDCCDTPRRQVDHRG